MGQSDFATENGLGLLLLGGTGFIGANLTRVLVDAGHRVFVTGRETEKPATDVHAYSSGKSVRHAALTLHAVEQITAFVARERIDTVVHLISSMKPSSTLADYQVEREAVLTPTLQLAATLADMGTRLIYFSSGGTIYGATAGDHAAEDDRCEPISFYGQSKLEVESHLHFLQRTRGLRSLVIRPSNPFGPYQSLQGTQGLVSVLLGRIASGCALEVWGDGSSVRDYIHVTDLVVTVRALIERGVHGVTLNIGSGEGHSLLEVVRVAEEVTGRQVPLEFLPARTADVPRLVLDIKRLRQMGLHKARPLTDGVRAYAAYLGMLNG